MSAPDFLIAGGGIGGLTCALALAARGQSSRVLEREREFVEAGAGIQIGPNGMHILRRLGVAELLASHAAMPRLIHVRDAVTGRTLNRVPLGDWINQRHGAPYWTAHRSDLQTALLEAVRRQPRIEILTGFELSSIAQTAKGTFATATDGRIAEAPFLVGADGARSAVRHHLFGPTSLVYSGRTAARAVIQTTDKMPGDTTSDVSVWLAPGAHVVHYPVRAGAELAVIVVVQEQTAPDGWNTSVTAAAVLASVAGLSPDLIALLGRADEWRKWALIDNPPPTSWAFNRAALLGDAAGPIAPFLAQGAVMAMEDAWALAHAVCSDPGGSRAFGRYENSRRPRRTRVQRAARRNGRIYHLSGAPALARNLALRMTSGERLLASYDWLYGYRADLD